MTQRHNVIIHVGYPKSASTTLQKHLFCKHPDINYLGAYPTANIGVDTAEAAASDCEYLRNADLRRFYHDLINMDSLEFTQGDTADLFKRSIRPLLSPQKLNVFSHEALTNTYSADRGVKARRLKRFFPNAKIIVIIRNQADFLRSQYIDHPFDPVCRGSGKPFPLGKWLRKVFKNTEKIKLAHSLHYAYTIQFYAGLFSPDHIGVFSVETLKDTPQRFCDRLSSFMGVESRTTYRLLLNRRENTAVSPFYNCIRSWERRLGFPFLRYLTKVVPEDMLKKMGWGKTKIPAVWRDWINTYYAESNRSLQSSHMPASDVRQFTGKTR